jgi:hypothetical protein
LQAATPVRGHRTDGDEGVQLRSNIQPPFAVEVPITWTAEVWNPDGQALENLFVRRDDQVGRVLHHVAVLHVDASGRRPGPAHHVRVGSTCRQSRVVRVAPFERRISSAVDARSARSARHVCSIRRFLGTLPRAGARKAPLARLAGQSCGASACNSGGCRAVRLYPPGAPRVPGQRRCRLFVR